ncbi:hypothetical protein COCMIDRAFT_27799 [Bipolaris oryzae ATCC 44560]|uniref:Transcription factor domain-containing protein n=1 Tax=Bipolaris oryzae ATCC 44560 TaxID=930090 RepID=W6YWJ3_COCMI|nr:uncharacterized protein COCMIDRAFT_27799 [Bipolaris oryzae ATCC 44560]EUC43737.1 hypothetical protein COCMIDRAFT_27799 [Bipolaris oryzae ATCC 44560]
MGALLAWIILGLTLKCGRIAAGTPIVSSTSAIAIALPSPRYESKKRKVHVHVGQTSMPSLVSLDQSLPGSADEESTCSVHMAERLSKLEQLFERFVCRKSSTNGTPSGLQSPPLTASGSSEKINRWCRLGLSNDVRSESSIGDGIQQLGAQTWTSAPSIQTLVDKQGRKESFEVYDHAHRSLVALLPSQRDADIVFESSNGWMILENMYRASEDIYVRKDMQSYALDMQAVAQERSIIVARTLLHLAICLNSLPADFDISRLSSIHDLDATVQSYVATVTSIVASSDEQMMTLHGLETLLLLAFYHLTNASMRQSWLVVRRGLNLAHLMGFQRIITQPDHKPPIPTVSNAKGIWRSFVDVDRYLCLHLRLPFGAENYPVPAEADSHLQHRAKLNEITQQVAELDREVSPQGYSTALKLDEKLEMYMRQMPKEFWEVPNIPPTARSPESSAALERLIVQIFHFETRMFIHLPYLLRAQQDKRYDYSKVTALHASRNVLMRWFALRNANMTQACCRLAETAVFIAAVTLTLDIVIELSSKDKMEVQQTKGTDFAMLCRLIGEMEKLAKAGGARERIAGRSAIALKKLLSSLDPNRQGTGSTRHTLPFFGTVELEFKKPPVRTGFDIDSDAGKLMNATASGDRLPIFSFTHNSLWPTSGCGTGSKVDWDIVLFDGLEDQDTEGNWVF